MTAPQSFGVRFTQSWVGIYTGGLPAEASERRRLEIESDLYEQVDESGDDRILGRCLRGMTADVWWRIRTLRENASQSDGSKLMTANPMRRWWVGVVLLHIAFTTVSSIPLSFINGDLSDPFAVFAISMAVVGLIGLTVMGFGLQAQKAKPVRGSWLILIGLLPTLFSVTGAGVLIFGFWTANLTLHKTTIETGYKTVAARNQAVIARTWWVWFATALVLFGVGWIGLFVDNWYLWFLPWATAAFTAVIGVGVGIAAYIGRHRTRAA